MAQIVIYGRTRKGGDHKYDMPVGFTEIDDKYHPCVKHMRWHLDSSGHVCTSFAGVNYFLHRLLFEIANGFLPEMLDHIDKNPLNNKIDNLRAADKSLNSTNRTRPKNNKSGYKGVSWDKQRKKWFVKIEVRKKQIALGRFENVQDAVCAYNSAFKIHFPNVTLEH